MNARHPTVVFVAATTPYGKILTGAGIKPG